MNRLTTIFLLAILFFVECVYGQTKSRGILAYPYLQEFKQPNGDRVQLLGRGDAVVNWFETSYGQKVLKTRAGWFEYTKLDPKGNMVPSGNRVNSKKFRVSSLFKRKVKNQDIYFNTRQLRDKEDAYFGRNNSNKRSVVLSSLDTKTQINRSFPSEGSKRKTLLILADFPNLGHNTDASIFDDLMNKVNYNNTGSFRDYYLETSYNKLDLETTVIVWVTVSHNYEYYGENSGDGRGNDVNPRGFIEEVVRLADESVDFSQFDLDKDGYVDLVQVIHAGYGEEASDDDNTIWSHSWDVYSKNINLDGVRVGEYITYPELSGGSGQDVTNIGVICHEFGHALGLPDYYDTDESGSGGKADGLGDWDIMSGGSWNNNGASPAHHNAYSKGLLGWIDLKELKEDNDIEIYNVEENAEAYYFKTKTEGDFYVLENRQKKGFDSYIPYHGMLVYHVDKSTEIALKRWKNNVINVNPSHQYMDLIEAVGGNINSSLSPFPGSRNVTAFSDNTTPNTKSWLGVNSNVYISGIEESLGVIKFNYIASTINPYRPQIVVSNNIDNNPIGGVNLTISSINSKGEELREYISNLEGDFSIGEINGGDYYYKLSKDGFHTKLGTFLIENDDLLSLNLKPLRTLVLKAMYDGIPIKDGDIIFESNTSEEDKLGPFTVSNYPSSSFKLDDTGKAILKNVPDGKYLLKFSKNKFYSFDEEISVMRDTNIVFKPIPFGIDEFVKEKLKIYPNPTNGPVTIETYLKENSIVRVLNMIGIVVFETRTKGFLNEIDLSNLASGIYTIEITDGKNHFMSRVILR